MGLTSSKSKPTIRHLTTGQYEKMAKLAKVKSRYENVSYNMKSLRAEQHIVSSEINRLNVELEQVQEQYNEIGRNIIDMDAHMSEIRENFNGVLRECDEAGLTEADIEENPYIFNNGELIGFRYNSVQCRAQSNVARLLSIYGDRDNEFVNEAVYNAISLGATEELLFDKNPHVWKDGKYVCYNGDEIRHI